MKVAVLGAGSCFAMNLASHLVDRGDTVLGISRSSMRTAPFTYGLATHPRFRYIKAHLVTQPHRIMVELDEFYPDVIVNFAALCEVGQSWNYALDYYETNLMSLVRLTNELQTRSWFKKFVQIGSSEVYGSVAAPANEHTAVKPSSPYAASKAAFDFHLGAIAKHQSFPAVICMPSNGYCEGQTLNRIIPKTIICALTGQKLQLQGGGVAKKSYLHADDISRGILLVTEKGNLGEVYNVGPAFSTQIAYLVELLAGMLGKTRDDVADIVQERTGQDSQYLLDSRKIMALGWRQQIPLEHGLQRMIDWVKKYPELVTMDQAYRHRP